ncbi:hypothetical protein N7486_005157 [Penicillium sp. IBT 16267x]|nr:hypothetical protein N7486_005157 [Penicillium sp. IBT 16267x]
MSSKQDNAHFDGTTNAEQSRRSNIAPQNQTTAARLGKTSQQKKQDDLGPTQLLEEHMDAEGNPVPDSPAGKQGKDDVDVYEAMTKDFD